MSVHVHVGQCGNQLGAAYWHLAASSSDDQPMGQTRNVSASTHNLPRTLGSSNAVKNPAQSSPILSRHLFHPTSQTARCILVDSEPKVIRTVCEGGFQGFKPIKPAHSHVEQAGRGNNWAMGYNGPRLKTQAPVFTSLGVDDRGELVDQVLESLRTEIEEIDCYQGSVVMHSLGGGTGSGLGCRVLERIRDAYPKSYIVTASIAPSSKCGDTPLQNYNAVLTLKCLNEVADAVIFKDNDDLLRTSAYWKTIVHGSQAHGDVRLSLAEMNSLVATDLAGLLFPVTKGGNSSPFDFGKLVHDVCPMPAAKMLDVRSGVWRDQVASARKKFPSKTAGGLSPLLFHAPVVPQVTSLARRHERPTDFETSLELLEKLVHQTAQAFPRTLTTTLASSAIIRGYPPASFSANESERFRQRLGHTVNASFPPAAWLATTPQSTATYSSALPFPALRAKASVTMCVNNGSFLPCTKHFLERAQRQFRANAYVHWYKQHGLEDDDFGTAFDNCGALIREYETLLR